MSDDEDDMFWRRVKRTVTPLEKGRSRPRQQEFKHLMRVDTPQPSYRPVSYPPAEIRKDKRTRRGLLDIGGKIDLHDMTRDAALDALKKAVFRNADQNNRVLLVITGRGLRGEGVLKTSFPGWMNDPDIRPFITGYAPAHIRHGGSGAWYVFLRRN